MNEDNHMPQASIDAIVTICCVLQGHDKPEPYLRQVFSLKDCAPIIGANIKSFKTEKDLLYAWERFMIEADPDIITGYNAHNFDFPYIMDRAHALGLKDYGKFSRTIRTISKVTSSTFSSQALGTRETKETHIEGRVQMDMLQIILTEAKLPSYTLNSVSQHFLNKQKEEVHHSMINRLHEKDEFTRRKLATYCLKDAYLALELMNKLLSVYNATELARVTGVPASYIFKRGQQVRVASQLYRKTKDEGLIIPCMHFEKGADDGIQYEGATVIQPSVGFYESPVTTLDFASLYPSVMIAHNICYTTLVPPSKISQLSPDQYEKTPSGDYFVRKEVREGLLPSILEKLLEARKRAKALAAKEQDQLTKMVLNSRQLALKISANSVYGFTGAVRGLLPCLPMSSSVTSYGREMILETKKAVEEYYTKENGYKNDAKVIYGDTDSVMILFGVDSIKEAMDLGKDASARVTKRFMKPIKLEYEKVYDPYLLLTKKRYAGLLFDNDPNKYRKLDAKGIETVRRDNCLLVKDLVSTSLELIIKKRDKEGALNYCREMISDLFLGKIDISNLIITKGIGKRTEEKKDATKTQYKAKLAHVELANRIKEENNGKNCNNVRYWTKCR
jgi:DNA polymerase delta subunit 1